MCKNVMAENARVNEIDLITAGRFDSRDSKKRLNHSREKRFPQPTKPEAGRSNPDLARGKIGVQIVLNLFYEAPLA